MIHKPVRRSLSTFLALALLAVALVFVLHPSPAPYLDLVRQGDEHAARTKVCRTATYIRANLWTRNCACLGMQGIDDPP